MSSEIARRITKGTPQQWQTWPIAAPSISQAIAPKRSLRRSRCGRVEMKISPLAMMPRTTLVSSKPPQTSSNSSEAALSQSKKSTLPFGKDTSPCLSPRAVMFISCSTARVPTTRSPMLTTGDTAPATPLLMTSEGR